MTGKALELAVLLCTFNGGRHLAAQLDSLVAPAHVRCTVYASDDGSTDNTGQLLNSSRLSSRGIALTVRQGPRLGHAANFLSLVTDGAIGADLFAYCDQDDVWDDDKLARAVNTLSQFDAGTPVLYCTRTRSIDASGRVIGYSPLFRKSPSFRNALLQNIAGGNTMVMNACARELLCSAGPVDVVAHDWWTYLLVSGAGGTVIFDPEPSVSYRQHDSNIVGANRDARSRMRRYGGFLSGRNRRWNARNIAALESCQSLLTPENRRHLSDFKRARDKGWVGRLPALRRSGVYAQTLSGNIGLWIATLLKKI